MPTLAVNEFGGVNFEVPVMDLEPGAMGPLSKDVFVGRGGRAIVARAGELPVTPVPDVYNNVNSMYWSRSGRLVVAHDAGATISHVQGDFSKITVGTALGVSGRWRFADAPAGGGAGTIFGVNGATMLQMTAAGSAPWTASAGTLPVGATHIAYAGNRVMLAGMTAFAGAVDPLSVVAASTIGNPRDWATAAPGNAWAVELGPKDGEFISQLVLYNDYLYVFKPSRTWVIYDLDTGANRLLSAYVGCPLRDGCGAIATPQGLMFMSRDQGLMLTNGSSVTSLSGDVLSKHALAANSTPEQIAYTGNRLFYSRFSDENVGWVYDFPTKSWTRHTIGSPHIVSWSPDGTAERFYSAQGGRIVRMFEPGRTVDATNTPLVPVWRSGALLAGDGRRRRYKSVRAFGTSINSAKLTVPGDTIDVGGAALIRTVAGELSEAYIRHVPGVHDALTLHTQLATEGTLTSFETDVQERHR